MSDQSLIMQSKSQVYSNTVFPQVQALIKEHSGNDDSLKRYRSLCKRSGGLLRSVGLIQWLSFLAAKAARGEAHHQYLLDNLVTELSTIKVLVVKDSDDLLLTIRKQNLPEYMYTTTQVLKLLQWHKHIADILITSGEVE